MKLGLLNTCFNTPVGARNMATLKEISLRLKSVSNIAKITKSMKMIASSKVVKATKTMHAARVYGSSFSTFFKHAETQETVSAAPLAIAVSSDRGLCGGIHSSISKATKKYMAKNPSAGVIILGQKAKSQIVREYKNQIRITFDQVAKNQPNWAEAATIVDEIILAKIPFDSGKIFYNSFKSAIAFEPATISIFSLNTISSSPKLSAYEVEEPVLKNFEEFALANSLYWAISEGYASEISARRSAMENATKNAGEMIQKLTLVYNRSRQAAITNDLIAIITGASCM